MPTQEEIASANEAYRKKYLAFEANWKARYDRIMAQKKQVFAREVLDEIWEKDDDAIRFGRSDPLYIDRKKLNATTQKYIAKGIEDVRRTIFEPEDLAMYLSGEKLINRLKDQLGFNRELAPTVNPDDLTDGMWEQLDADVADAYHAKSQVLSPFGKTYFDAKMKKVHDVLSMNIHKIPFIIEEGLECAKKAKTQPDQLTCSEIATRQSLFAQESHPWSFFGYVPSNKDVSI